MTDMKALSAGFADPVADAQATFRALLEAMARPGRPVQIAPSAGLAGVLGLAPAAAATALALCDFETPVWLGGRCASAASWLRFHCGAPVVADPGVTRFAFAAQASDLPPLDAFDLGSDEFPDRSTTLLLEVAAFNGAGGLMLAGPGIAASYGLAVQGFDAGFWNARAALTELFPRGLDLILTSGTQVVALPRTTRVEV